MIQLAMQQPPSLIITGGHVTPALAIIDRLQERNLDVSVLFVGRKFNNNTEETLSLEYQEVTKRSVPFIHLTTGRLTRILSITTIIDFFRIPLGFMQAFWIIIKYKPHAILSFGGYLALPIALVGSVFGIPVYTHEQTIELGLSNRIIGTVAKKIFTSFPETNHPSFESKITYTGNPLRKNIRLQKLLKTYHHPLIYVTGGSLGSHAINLYIEYNLSALLERYYIIHQTGNVAEFDDHARLRSLREALPDDKLQRYEIYTHIPTDEVGAIMSSAELIVSRSGANTFFELIALAKPSVLVPLPWSASQEQRKHAELLRDAGVATIVDQGDSNEHFLDVINTMMKKHLSYEKNFKQLQGRYITQASDTIIDAIIDKK
jgi:UDP-N-acetylglucosamine--N-acetylmuramyl-(pentapeptide) pyrophosphoryl-undecaprenol N-acetylglucosamine transferase